MKGIPPVNGLDPRSVKSISSRLGCTPEEVARAAKGDENNGSREKPNLRLRAMVERAQRGSFR